MQTHAPTVRQFMTPNPVIIDGGLSIADAFTRMFQIHARHLPVYVHDHLVGILSDRDIGHLSAVQGIDANRCTAEQACSPNPYVCGPDTPLLDVAQVLAQHRFGAALVMEGGQLVGMFTVVDAMQALVAVLHRDATNAADPDHTWNLTSAGPGVDDPNRAPDVDLDTRHGHTGPDLDHRRDVTDRPDIQQGNNNPEPNRDEPVHAHDPSRSTLQTVEARRADINSPALQRSGAMHGVSSDVRSDAGRRTDLRRAAATVHRS